MSRTFLVTIIVILVIVVLGGGIYLWQEKAKNEITQTKNEEIKQVSESQSASTSSATPPTTANSVTSNSLSTNTICDNFQCLISAASQCKPISVSISYSGMPVPSLAPIFFPGESATNSYLLISGRKQYEIKKSSGVNNCTFIFSSPVTLFSVTDIGRKEAQNQGTTDAQLAAYIQSLNDDYNETAEDRMTCLGKAGAISDYLTDEENNLKTGNLRFKVEIYLKDNTATYTTSSGKKLVCTNSANSL